jgi:hypothetical protein
MAVQQLILRILVTSILFIGVIRFGHLSRAFKVVVFYLLASDIAECLGLYLIEKQVNNNWVFQGLSTISILLFYWIFKNSLKSLTVKKWLNYSFGLLFILGVFLLTRVYSFDEFPSYTMVLICIAVMVFCFIKFKEMLDEPEGTNILRQSQFWLFTSMFFFHAGTFFIWLTDEYLLPNFNTGIVIYWVVFYLNILHYGLIGVGLYLDHKRVL